MTTECRCEKCAKLCSGRPGWFSPGQATKAAAELGLTFKEFFKRYLTIDYWVNTEEGDVHLLSPGWSWTADQASRLTYRPEPRLTNVGEIARWGDAFSKGPCALLGENGCRLSAEARPEECRVAFACKPAPAIDPRKEIVERWKEECAEVQAALSIVEPPPL